MIRSLFKQIIPIVAMIPLLGSCSVFQPQTKVIEYDEEVKLHDGSMIWVHIKRHYERSNGREISNWFQGYEKGWGAKEVEISWDTGFPNVGRKSLEFTKNISLIDKVNNKWYVGGFTPQCKSPCIKDSYIKLNAVGSLAVINNLGNFELNASLNDLPKNIQHNILSPEKVNDWDSLTMSINKLSWSDKLTIQKTNPQSVVRPVF
ncbi:MULTISPECIES: hypothetical protein [unclassified Moraxella]|uniref:hypothetical protein n=1 Tax=unclassified Moraxella TaxID=2685852 RepID=UPI003AF882E6